nr:MAG TPA: hypothetical protein [Caudoviricetes sp.]
MKTVMLCGLFFQTSMYYTGIMPVLYTDYS